MQIRLYQVLDPVESLGGHDAIRGRLVGLVDGQEMSKVLNS